MVPQGKCQKCGELYYGWALKEPKHRTCELCGAPLKIKLYPNQAEVAV